MQKMLHFFCFYLLLCSPAASSALELVVVRHGQTEWNRLGFFQGASNIPLDETGRQQAIDARSKFRGMHIDAVICSSLSRAHQTAEILSSEWALEPLVDPRWGEISFGEFEGQCPQDVDRSQIDTCLALPAGQGEHGVETLEDFEQRMQSALEHLIQAYQHEERVLLVTHGGVQRWLIERLFRNDAELSTRYKNLEYLVAELDSDGVFRTTGRG